MTNEDFRTVLEQNKFSAQDIEKITARLDSEEIDQIVDAAHSPREAFENIKKSYPEFDVEEALKQMDFVHSQIDIAAKDEKTEGPVELTEEELENIAGGGWWSDNWKGLAKAIGKGLLAGAITGFVGGAIGGAIVGGIPGAIFGMVVGTPAVALGIGILAGVDYVEKHK